MLYFFGVKGVIRSYRSAQELKADTLTPASHLALTTLTPLTPLTPKKLSNLRNLSNNSSNSLFNKARGTYEETLVSLTSQSSREERANPYRELFI